ncbi:unnamed protein product [Penicillium discolor]
MSHKRSKSSPTSFPTSSFSQLSRFPKNPIADLPTDRLVMPQWIGSLTSQNGNSLAGVFMINGEPWVFEKNARGQPAAPFQRAPAVVNIPWKELDSIRQSLQSCEPFTATIMGSTMEIVWSNGVRITANVPHCDTYGYFSGEGGWRTQ